MLPWIGFALSLVLLAIVSRKDLALGMAIAAIALALFTHSFASFGAALWATVSDPSVLLLALIVGMIPMIGGAMDRSGQMDRLVSNLRIGIRPFLALAPALLGMLPMPGGTLLSAPLIERSTGPGQADVKAAINVWFRHALLLVYPLGPALIASAKVAHLEVYGVISYLALPFAATLVLGYVFLLRRIHERQLLQEAFSLAGLAVPLLIILAAPVLDLILKQTAHLPYEEIGTTIGILFSLLLAIGVGRIGMSDLSTIVRQARPWRYVLIILAMFAFLNVFTTSGVPERIGALSLPPVLLCVVIGAALGMITGRIQAPMLILVPIYLSTQGAMSAPAFAVTFFAVFLGYLITPIHPCISVSLEYFDTPLGPFLRRLAVPTAVAWLVTLLVGLLVF